MGLIEEAEAKYQKYDLDNLPEDLKRDSLKHYYLSVYPAITNMKEVKPRTPPQYPDEIKSVYVHTPYCTGACDFCSYVIIPLKSNKVKEVQKIVDIEDLDALTNTTVPTVQQYYELLKKDSFP